MIVEQSLPFQCLKQDESSLRKELEAGKKELTDLVAKSLQQYSLKLKAIDKIRKSNDAICLESKVCESLLEGSPLYRKVLRAILKDCNNGNPQVATTLRGQLTTQDCDNCGENRGQILFCPCLKKEFDKDKLRKDIYLEEVIMRTGALEGMSTEKLERVAAMALYCQGVHIAKELK